MNKKRGQVTIYVVLGIVIFFTLIIFGYLIFGNREGVPNVFSSDFDDVRATVDNCVYRTLEDGVKFNGGTSGDNYEPNIEEYMISYLPLCVNFSMFEKVEVEAYRIENVVVSLDEDKIKADVVFPITVSRGESEMKFMDFHSELSLREKGCVKIKVDDDCRALEDKTINMFQLILTYKKGDFVGVGNECVAC